MAPLNVHAAKQSLVKLGEAVRSVAWALESAQVNPENGQAGDLLTEGPLRDEVEALTRLLQQSLLSAHLPPSSCSPPVGPVPGSPPRASCMLSSLLRTLHGIMCMYTSPHTITAQAFAPDSTVAPGVDREQPTKASSVMLVGRVSDGMLRAADRARAIGLTCEIVQNPIQALMICKSEARVGAVMLSADSLTDGVAAGEEVGVLSRLRREAADWLPCRRRYVRVLRGPPRLRVDDVLRRAGLPPAMQSWDYIDFSVVRDAMIKGESSPELSAAVGKPEMSDDISEDVPDPPRLAHPVSHSSMNSCGPVLSGVVETQDEPSAQQGEDENSVGSFNSSGEQNCNAVVVRRTKRACAYCHTKKVHCSGGRPCQRCEGANRECVEYAPKPRVNKRPASLSSPGNHHAILSSSSSSSTSDHADKHGHQPSKRTCNGGGNGKSPPPTPSSAHPLSAASGVYEALTVLSHAASLASNPWPTPSRPGSAPSSSGLPSATVPASASASLAISGVVNVNPSSIRRSSWPGPGGPPDASAPGPNASHSPVYNAFMSHTQVRGPPPQLVVGSRLESLVQPLKSSTFLKQHMSLNEAAAAVGLETLDMHQRGMAMMREHPMRAAV